MVRTIARDEWCDCLPCFGRAHAGWIVTVHGTAPTGEVAQMSGALHAVALEGERPFDAVRIDVSDEARVYVVHPRVIRLQQCDGIDQALEIDTAEGATTRVAFRALARPEEVDGLAPGECEASEATTQPDDTLVLAHA